ncbi:glycoside hydrolase family 3 N-terminal domain-containing protein [Cytophagaceae bacterium ABcell3]|nr:glycoside hydrolase family 3 N-terminal domain-containing protein [Cytophagaceae bacterium ABcell3]
MMKISLLNKVSACVLAVSCAFMVSCSEPENSAQVKKASANAVKYPLTDAETDKRVQELISKMSVEEKVGQMTQVNLNVLLKGGYANQDGTIDDELLKKAVSEYKVGSILNAINHAYDLDTWHTIIKAIQDEATNNTPNNIPVLYGIDAIHGVTFTLESTLFPQNIGIGAARNKELSRLAGEITAKETRASGIRWNFAPVLDVGRQPLWPRFGETYGEDVNLVKELGVASIKGMEGDGELNRVDRVASCMKHYIGYSDPRSGKDRTPAFIPERQLREFFLPPFIEAVKSGSHTIMINSGDVNGIPVHGNHYLLTTILRDELGFEGVAVSDWEDIIRLHTKHRVARTPKEAVKMGVMAGVDMSMVPHDFSFHELLVELVNEGEVPMSRIDEAVSRILALKFKVGLFDNAYPEPDAIEQFGKGEYKTAALDAARESITLLKNADNTLPLAKGKKVLVTGPAANSHSSLNGAWSYTWQGTDEKWYPEGNRTVVEAIQDKVGEENVVFTKGTRFERRDFDIKETAEKAKDVDYVVVCIGEDAYAESPGVIDNLDLPEVQQRLVKAMYATGKPVILVLVEGRPRIIREIEEDAKGIVLAYIPGSQGGPAIADVLFGDYNPNGKLPYSYPRFSGDLLTYDHTQSDRVTELAPGKMGEGGYKPQWPFGFGLSYTTFEYSNIKTSSAKLSDDNSIKVSVDVTNTGKLAGKEAVELYSRTLYASVVPRYRRLRDFSKVDLEPGETKTVSFEIGADDLKFVGTDSKTFVIEPGDIELHIGNQSATISYGK